MIITGARLLGVKGYNHRMGTFRKSADFWNAEVNRDTCFNQNKGATPLVSVR